MATLDFYKSDGTQVKVSLADDPANPGQYLPKSNGDLLLGTPGTGEPAHAGGSTGLIGWARDILAKIAAFGTSAAPSADVLSVQYPNAYVGKATLGVLNAALTVDTLGASQISFHFPNGTSGCGVLIEATNSNATVPTWNAIKYLRTAPVSQIYNLTYGAMTGFSAGDVINADCAGFSQVRIRIAAFAASFEVLATRIYCPGIKAVFAELSNQTTLTVVASLNTGVYYTDTTTPLAANATFTGSTRTMAVGNNRFTANMTADVSSAANGFRIRRSTDNTNWYYGAEAWDSANLAAQLTTIRTAPFYQLYIANGPSPQTVFVITSSQTPN